MKPASQVILDLWYLPSILPLALQGLTWIFDNFLYKDRDYASDVLLLISTNKVGKVKALKVFIEAQFVDGVVDELQDQCDKLISELGRRERLENKLYGYKKAYRQLCGCLLFLFVATLVVGLAGFILIAAYPKLKIWWLIAGIVLACSSVGNVIAMRVFSSKLNTIKDDGDLQA